MVGTFILFRTISLSALFFVAMPVAQAAPVVHAHVNGAWDVQRSELREPLTIEKRIGCFIRGGWSGCLREDSPEEASQPVAPQLDILVVEPANEESDKEKRAGCFMRGFMNGCLREDSAIQEESAELS